jgi:class 3 adenylate cyclase
MESTGLPGRIQLSAKTAERLQGLFNLESRGDVDVKGIGHIHTYLISK